MKGIYPKFVLECAVIHHLRIRRHLNHLGIISLRKIHLNTHKRVRRPGLAVGKDVAHHAVNGHVKSHFVYRYRYLIFLRFHAALICRGFFLAPLPENTMTHFHRVHHQLLFHGVETKLKTNVTVLMHPIHCTHSQHVNLSLWRSPYTHTNLHVYQYDSWGEQDI